MQWQVGMEAWNFAIRTTCIVLFNCYRRPQSNWLFIDGRHSQRGWKNRGATALDKVREFSVLLLNSRSPSRWGGDGGPQLYLQAAKKASKEGMGKAHLFEYAYRCKLTCPTSP